MRSSASRGAFKEALRDGRFGEDVSKRPKKRKNVRARTVLLPREVAAAYDAMAIRLGRTAQHWMRIDMERGCLARGGKEWDYGDGQ